MSTKLVPWAFAAALALGLVSAAACGGAQAEPTPLPPPIETTLDAAAQYGGQRVVSEGYLVTDGTISCGTDSTCWLSLSAAPADDDGVTYRRPDLFILLGIHQQYGDPYPNTIAHVPVQWKPSDIVVTSDDGLEVHLNDRVRVTGWVEVNEKGTVRITGPGPCESFSGQEKLDLVKAHACPETGFTIELLEE